MDTVKTSDKLTVYFDDPFWVGVFEHTEDGKLSVSKVTFGAEPKDYEIREFIIRNYYRLEFSPAVDIMVKDSKRNMDLRYSVVFVCEGCSSSLR